MNETLSLRPGSGHDRLYVLVLREGSSSIVHLPRDGRLVVGRDPEAEVRIDDRAASRQHAMLLVKRGEVEVSDLASHNGTRVNGEVIAGPRALGSGDVVAIGDTTLVLHASRAAPLVKRPLDAAAFARRLDDELARAVHFGRPLSLAVVDLGKKSAELANLVSARLREVDVVGATDTELCLAFPELAPAQLPELLQALARHAPGAHAGIASYPDDGTDGEALLSVARAAARKAAPGQIAPAGVTASELDLGERRILVADPAMLKLFELVRRLAKSHLPVLITGETGAGKESAAFAVHHWSPRAAERFLPINCAALPENLLESELFGYEKGAFSGAQQAKPGLLEMAAGGTVFFDEVGELPAAAQAKLLRVLEDKKLMRLGGLRELDVDVRVVAATNRDLEAEVKAGRFRADLFFRLSGASVVLPPLRDRPRELAILLRAFLAEACVRLGRAVPSVSTVAMAAMARYQWPGNVRELKNAIDFAAAAADDVIGLEQLPERVTREDDPADESTPSTGETTATAGTTAPSAFAKSAAPKFRPIADEIAQLERTRLGEALAAAGGVKARAARLIDMPLRTFVAKLKLHGIE